MAKKRVMWWNLPPEEIDELRDAGQLKAFTCVEYDDEEEEKTEEKEIMDELTFIDRIKKIIKMRHDDVVSAMASGGVDNMEKYQYMLGQIRTYQYLSQEISSLLNKKEQKDNEGTVININSKSKD